MNAIDLTRLMSRYLWITCLALAVVMTLGGAQLGAQGTSPAGGRVMVKAGVKLGMLYSSRFRIDGVASETGIGLSGGVVFDFPISRRFLYGVAIDLQDVHVFETRKKVLDLSLPLKYAFPFERQNWELRIVSAAGFAYHTKVDVLERSTYLTLKGGLEAVFHGDTRFSMVVDLLVFAAPIGGNRDNRVSYGPTLIARMGFVY
jgi:hypothetical protein